jgi:hypothetical protein
MYATKTSNKVKDTHLLVYSGKAGKPLTFSQASSQAYYYYGYFQTKYQNNVETAISKQK